MSDSGSTGSKVGKVLLIGVTGGTGGNVVKGFREQQLTNLRAITRKIDLNRPSLSKMTEAGVELVEANLDDENSLTAAMTGISSVYCHATSADSAKPDPLEVERAKREQLAEAFSQAQGTSVIYKETPAWIFLFLFQKELYALIQWYRHKGYQADMQSLRQEFPGLLTTFDEFLQETNWANKELP